MQKWELEKEIVILNNQIQALNNQIQALNAKNDRLNEINVELRGENNQCWIEIEKLKKELSKYV